jgi:hypothetical protein
MMFQYSKDPFGGIVEAADRRGNNSELCSDDYESENDSNK